MTAPTYARVSEWRELAERAHDKVLRALAQLARLRRGRLIPDGARVDRAQSALDAARTGHVDAVVRGVAAEVLGVQDLDPDGSFDFVEAGKVSIRCALEVAYAAGRAAADAETGAGLARAGGRS